MRVERILSAFPRLKDYNDALEEVSLYLTKVKTFSSNPTAKYSTESVEPIVLKAIKKEQKEFDESIWKSKIKVIECWMKQKGYKLNFVPKAENCFWDQDKSITINSNLVPETQFYYLLHECGHLLLRENKTFKEQYPYTLYDRFANINLLDSVLIETERKVLRAGLISSISDEEGFKIKHPKFKLVPLPKVPFLATKEYCFLTIKEEIEAWERGRALAKKFSLDVNEKKLLKIQTKCIYSYMFWALISRTPEC